jgi:hypothetical protein
MCQIVAFLLCRRLVVDLLLEGRKQREWSDGGAGAMIIQRCRRIAPAVFFAGVLTAQAPFRTITAGSEFKLEGLNGHADDVPGGRRFRVGAFEEISVRAPIHMPASSAADHTLQRLIIRFRTSDQGPA